ncbi:unnamed protein product [Owenia fusiformis]|uniref:BZIP domain-containing protein n=1 Tax=Owenia fusiformis TaxID=6347 RepID=A0A8S4NRM1_OWEFU|nr:unnamed protein product [Owenia fusiformis]
MSEQLEKQLMKTRRRSKTCIPTECKDDRYWEKRKRNNEAARKSREIKRNMDLSIKGRNAALDRENLMLKQELNAIKAKYGLPINKNFITGKEYQPSSERRFSEDEREHASGSPMYKHMKHEDQQMHEMNDHMHPEEPHMMSRNNHGARIHNNANNRLIDSSVSPGQHRSLLAGDQGFVNYMMQPNEPYWDHNQGTNHCPDSTEQSDVPYQEARHNTLPQSLPDQPTYAYRYNQNSSQYGRHLDLLPTDLSKGEPRDLHNHTEMNGVQKRFHQEQSTNDHFRPSQRMDRIYDGIDRTGDNQLNNRQEAVADTSPMKKTYNVKNETTHNKDNPEETIELREQLQHLTQEVARMKDYMRVPLRNNSEHK